MVDNNSVVQQVMQDPHFGGKVSDYQTSLIIPIVPSEKESTIKKYNEEMQLLTQKIDELSQRIAQQRTSEALPAVQDNSPDYQSLLDAVARRAALQRTLASLENPQPAAAIAAPTATPKKEEEENAASRYTVSGATASERKKNVSKIKELAADYLKEYKDRYKREHPNERLPEWLAKCKFVEKFIANDKDMASLPQAVREHMEANGLKPPINMLFFSAGKDKNGQEIAIPPEFRRNFLDVVNRQGLVGNPEANPGLTIRTREGNTYFELNQNAPGTTEQKLTQIRRALENTLSEIDGAKVEQNKNGRITIALSKPVTRAQGQKLNSALRSLVDQGLLTQHPVRPEFRPSSHAVSNARQDTAEARQRREEEERQNRAQQQTQTASGITL